MIVVFLGAPGAGKGTVASYLKKHNDVVHISTGEIFRHHIKTQTPLGRKVQLILANGHLVDDQTTLDLLIDTLKGYDPKTQLIILDGFPRTIRQAQLLQDYCREMKYRFDRVVLLDIDEELIIERLTGRKMCPLCQRTYHVKFLKEKNKGYCDEDNTKLIIREDDQIKKVKERLNEYRKQTEPLIKFYKSKGTLYSIDASKELEETVKEVKKIINIPD